MRRRDNVGGLVERVTCHMFWFLRRPFFFLSLFLRSRYAIARRPILTIYTSYDVFPRSDVPFWGPVVATHHLLDQIPKTPIWGVNRLFQA